MCGLIFCYKTSVDEKVFKKALSSLSHRGPDDERLKNLDKVYLGFSRLAIMDLSHNGDQPFEFNHTYFLCNGEIYNHQKLRAKYSSYQYKSQSDCEVLIPMFFNTDARKMLNELDGEFSFVIYDETKETLFAARDPIGIRPLFYGITKDDKIAFASEVKALQNFCKEVYAFPPGCYYLNGKFNSYTDLTHVDEFIEEDLDQIGETINKLLTDAVEKRLNADAPVGFLLSGGLDSSLVCAIAQKKSKSPIKTFAIGMSEDAIDLKYAKEVADYIGSDHTEVIITPKDVLDVLSDVIYSLETYDITTIRASIGMYLVCKYIKEQTNIKVLLTGEVSDEIFGYKYTDFAPNPFEFQAEAAKRVRELYMYDVLRADRCISAHSLEARVPFSDKVFVEYVMRIDPKIKMNSYGHGKYLLRKSFEKGDYLPQSILYREKAAFSDAVGHSLVEHIKTYAESLYSDKELLTRSQKFKHAQPFTKESLLYREVFEKFYPNKSYLIRDFWMPNKSWKNCNVDDPSARVLPNYGMSGT
jgi:asparagine synthase (glutamine-hydrolysing)